MLRQESHGAGTAFVTHDLVVARSESVEHDHT
jgi:hypothetical protein